MSSKSKTGRGRLLPLAGPERNVRHKMHGFDLLAELPVGCARLAFLDPQYRTGLDKLKFGNEGARQIGRAELPQMKDDDIVFMIEEIARVLTPSGYLMLWIDKFALAEGVHLKYLSRARSLQKVDLLHWNKMRPGMGRRTRIRSEYLVIAQKLPIRAKGTWTDHGIDDSWAEVSDRDRHVHAKPFRLTERLIRATTKIGDLVIDPCAGGFGVLDACLASRREFVGCDLLGSPDDAA